MAAFRKESGGRRGLTSGGIGRGVGFAVLSFALFSVADAAVKWLVTRYPVTEVTFLVAVFALAPVAWLMARGGGWAALRPRRPLWVAVRALLLAADTLLVYYAFSRLPLAEAYVLVFAAPMLVTALSVPLLGEAVGWRRWSAVAVGFAGVLVVLQPGFAALDPGHLAALAAAVLFALSLIVLRRFGGGESSAAMLVAILLATMAISGPAVPAVFVPPGAGDLAVLALAGLLGGLGHLALIEAFRTAPAAAVSPFHYTQILWGIAFGLVLFGDVPGPAVLLGAGIIIASGLFILWRERRR